MRKGIYELVGFIWVFLVIFFLGISILIFGVKELKYSIDDMIVEKGTVTNIKSTSITLIIKLDNYPHRYETTVSKKIEAIKDNLKQGDFISIYRKDESMYFIQRIVKDDMIIVDYKKLTMFSILISFVALLLIGFSIYYLFRKIKQYTEG